MILVSKESPRSIEPDHANEGDIEGYHIGKMITCFPRIHDGFIDFSSISLVSAK